MTQVLILRVDAPLVAFGASAVDQNRVVQPFPARSLLAGLLANALGWDHVDHERTQRLQSRLRFAARIDHEGESLIDYQTVDLGAPWMDPTLAGWTTRGAIATRAGASSEGTHIRLRHYRADSVHTIAIELLPEREVPRMEDLAQALLAPARPLFIGRKACLPARPLLLDPRRPVIDMPNALMALASIPRDTSRTPIRRISGDDSMPAWWDAALGTSSDGVQGPFEPVVVTDERDWANQIHTGRSHLWHGRIRPAVQHNLEHEAAYV